MQERGPNMKKQIKLILADIDGTLLNSNHEVTEKTRTAIGKLKDKGILFGIATGRSPYAVKHLLKEWGLEDDTALIMGFNGGSVMDMRTGEMISVLRLSGQAIPQIQKDLEGFDYNIGMYEGETFKAMIDDEKARRIALSNRFEFIQDDFSCYIDKEMGKLLVIADKEEMDRIVSHYETLPPSPLYHTFRSAPILLECVNPELSKSRGIQLMLEHMDLKPEELMTFGDAMNDFDMIRDYVGVAMANGDERVKAVASFITLSNDEDGIGVFLNEYFGLEEQEISVADDPERDDNIGQIC